MGKKTKKCAGCGREVDPNIEIIEVIGGKNYCPTCATTRKKEIQVNKELNDFLYNLCGKENDLMPFLTKQVKRMKEEYDYKASGILATLKYVFVLSDAPPTFKIEYGIEGVVVRNYYKARKYYEQVYHLKQQSPEAIDEALLSSAREVHLSRQVMTSQEEAFTEKRKNMEYGPLIDLDSIEDEEAEEEGNL